MIECRTLIRPRPEEFEILLTLWEYLDQEHRSHDIGTPGSTSVAPTNTTTNEPTSSPGGFFFTPQVDRSQAIKRLNRYLPGWWRATHWWRRSGQAYQGRALIGAYLDGVLVAFAAIEIKQSPPVPLLRQRRILDIHGLIVDPSHRRRGIGTTLIAHLCGLCAKLAISSIESSIWEWNTAIQRVYEKLNFTTISRKMLTQIEIQDKRGIV